ncbi:hypothetical protein [Mycobacteroides chelonae]|uniref:hypothetical protein n=1 Tax=Mycobacteroides chelonae TaxID=1774 RepID=UPI00104229E8|nr:hypothetical protein [Mycobacteroides chelonae]
MTDLIPFARVIERVRKLANDYPERVAECEYFNNAGEPQCIWGHVFADLGCTIKFDEEGDLVVAPGGARVIGASDDLDGYVPAWEALGIEPPTPDQRQWSAEVQSEQDSPSPWGFAVGIVDEYFRRRGISV